MNERIKELSDKCGLAWTLKTEQDVKNLVEFAELIAQDAVNTLRKRWFDANNSVPTTSDARLQAIHNGRKIGLMESVDALVEHFGLER